MMKISILNIVFSLILIFGVRAQDSDQKIIILYDNYQLSENTISHWGYSCLIISGKDTILFDTGARKDIFFHNLDALHVDLKTVQTMVISHHHGDHVGNIFPVLEETGHIQVYLPSSLNGKFRQMVDKYGVHTEIDKDIRQIAHKIFLTDEMGFQVREQGLVIESENGLVLITGCGHPGVDRMVRKVCKKFDKPIYMVAGGFHLEEFSDEEIDDIIHTFKECGVKKVAPGHCTGQRAMEKFRKAYRENFIRCGTGKTLEL